MATAAVNADPANEINANAIITIVWYSKDTILNKVAAMSNTFKIESAPKNRANFLYIFIFISSSYNMGIILSQSFFSNVIPSLLHEY